MDFQAFSDTSPNAVPQLTSFVEHQTPQRWYLIAPFLKKLLYVSPVPIMHAPSKNPL